MKIKKKIILIAALIMSMGIVSGVVFANSRVNFDAELLFSSATDDSVVLNITNNGRQDLIISRKASYMDELGTAGPLECIAAEDTVVRPGEMEYIHYELPEAVTHGDNSVMSFYFLHDEYWYMCKTGAVYGTEIIKDNE